MIGRVSCTQEKRINDRRLNQAEFFNAIDVKRTLGIGQPTSHLGGEGPLAERREWGIAGLQGPSGKGLAPAVLRVWWGNLLSARA
jgi:hypothetical protein